MEGSREGQGNHLSEEFQDESGLELSLGLGLSSADSRQKWKAPEGPAARSSISVDHPGEPSVGGIFNGTNFYGKLKASSKSSGIDAALKKFLEGRVDEQDESNTLPDATNSFNRQKEQEKPTSLGPQERSGQQLEVGLDMDYRGKPFLFKELQGSSGQATFRGQSPTHTSPLLVDALKVSPLGSTSSSPSSGEGVGHFDGDDGTQEGSEQHKKFQEVQKKRKHPIEEHKHQKKDKKEDLSGTHGFRMPVSNTWVSASAPDMDISLLGPTGNNTEQAQQETRQESRDELKGFTDTDGNESTGFDKNGTGMGLRDSRGTGDDPKGVEVNFMPRLQATEMDKKLLAQAENHEWNLSMQSHAGGTMKQSQGIALSMKGLSSSPTKQKDGQGSILANGRKGDKEGSPLQWPIEKVPSETSSASTEGTEKVEEKGHSSINEASSSAPEVMGSEKANPVSAPAPFFPPGATASTAVPAYPISPYPVMPKSHSLSGSMPFAPGMPFPNGLNFPYVLQYLPPYSSDQNPVRPGSCSSFQPLAGTDFPPHQLSSLEGAPWMQTLRPPVGVPFTNASNGALHSRNAVGMMEDADNRPQGTRVHDNGSGNVDTSSFQNHSFVRTIAHNSNQDSQLHQGLDMVPHPSLPIPAVPHFSSQLPMSDPGELRAVKEQGSITSFPGFAAQCLLPAGGSARPPSSSGGVREGGGQDQARFTGKVEHGHHRNMGEPSGLGPEELSRSVIGGQFQQGSTENLSFGDESGGEDMALLQRGIAPGLKFGGSGAPPDLPWVYATGPNGRAVGGVLYRLRRTPRVVCACHGKHMSPAEFTQHAGGSDITNAEKDAVVKSSPLTSPAT